MEAGDDGLRSYDSAKSRYLRCKLTLRCDLSGRTQAIKNSTNQDQMCKILVRSHACGHEVVVGRKPCFLVKSEFQCADEEKSQARPSRHDCDSCRRRQIKIRKAGSIHRPVKAQSDTHYPDGDIQQRQAAKTKHLDPAFIIANLKVLCAEVAAEKHAEANSRPETVQNSLEKVGKAGTGPSTASTTTQEYDFKECAVPDQAPVSRHERHRAKEISFSDSRGETDADARRSSIKSISSNPSVRRCQHEHRRSGICKATWTRDHSYRVESPEGGENTLDDSHARLPSLRRVHGHYKSPLSRDSAVRTELAGENLPPSRKRRRSSSTSTASARSAKRRINAMLAQEFKQTAHLGDIVLQSPKVSPTRLATSEEYDPARSYLAFVKSRGYGQ